VTDGPAARSVACGVTRLRRSAAIAGAVLVLVAAFHTRRAQAYRPFVSTDAAVADTGEIEIEFGYIGFRQRHGDTTIVAPTVIADLGVLRDVELVAETNATHDLAGANGSQAEDTQMSVKWVAHEGVLQDRGPAPSVAVELSLLVPTATNERHVGGELIGIVSGETFGITYHLNAGATVDTMDTEPGVIWGVILEHPLRGRLRAVAEVDGDAVRGSPPDDSALIGAIWDVAVPPPLHSLSLDAGVRRGISGAAADWGGTAGFTVALPW
jgi:hypothetical protein